MGKGRKEVKRPLEFLCVGPGAFADRYSGRAVEQAEQWRKDGQRPWCRTCHLAPCACHDGMTDERRSMPPQRKLHLDSDRPMAAQGTKLAVGQRLAAERSTNSRLRIGRPDWAPKAEATTTVVEVQEIDASVC